MHSMEKVVYSTSRIFNRISGIALVLMMTLVFGNVVLRLIWRPILGAYEFIGFLASLTISFALAHCAVNKGHVAISLMVDRLPVRLRALLDTIVSAIGAGLYLILAWQCSKYAVNTWHTGEVSLTTETPFYPFIFGVAFGLLMLASVLLVDLFKSLGKALNK